MPDEAARSSVYFPEEFFKSLVRELPAGKSFGIGAFFRLYGRLLVYRKAFPLLLAVILSIEVALLLGLLRLNPGDFAALDAYFPRLGKASGIALAISVLVFVNLCIMPMYIICILYVLRLRENCTLLLPKHVFGAVGSVVSWSLFAQTILFFVVIYHDKFQEQYYIIMFNVTVFVFLCIDLYLISTIQNMKKIYIILKFMRYMLSVMGLILFSFSAYIGYGEEKQAIVLALLCWVVLSAPFSALHHVTVVLLDRASEDSLNFRSVQVF